MPLTWISKGQGTISLLIEKNIVMLCFPHQENIYKKVMQGHLSRYRFKHKESTFTVTNDQRDPGHFSGKQKPVNCEGCRACKHWHFLLLISISFSSAGWSIEMVIKTSPKCIKAVAAGQKANGITWIKVPESAFKLSCFASLNNRYLICFSFQIKQPLRFKVQPKAYHWKWRISNLLS